MRAELERLPPLSQEHADLTLAYDASTAEIDQRARRAWRRAAHTQHSITKETAQMVNGTPEDHGKVRTRLLAVEVLLTEPETLGNDALEGDLYILRDHLTAALSGAPPTES
jgi:hypothetical protein